MTDVEAPGPLGAALRRDLAANRGETKSLVLVVSYRLASAAHRASRQSTLQRIALLPVLVAYRLLVEWVLGVELPAATPVGPGLRVRHGQGLVVNPTSTLGADVLLRHGVTIGNIRRGPGEVTTSPVIGDGVEIGANAVVVGPITIGAGARIGAGTVVSTDVPPGATVRPPRPQVTPANVE
ncbi:MAG: serine acetyltransferase [Acidimicrobiales bacterium]|nr:serine acetyltransferase [Acidimicrobiales bacterium]